MTGAGLKGLYGQLWDLDNAASQELLRSLDPEMMQQRDNITDGPEVSHKPDTQL
jgi:hypothetical protein